MHRTPLAFYNKCMGMLSELKDSKLDIDLNYLADFVESVGISKTVPVDEYGSVSLSFALALLFGMVSEPHVDDFAHLLDCVPPFYKQRFIMCWECLEYELGEDIVSWSEREGTSETVSAIRNLAKQIQFY